MNTYTVFCRDADNTGTTFITAVEAEDVMEAKEIALEECADAWGYDVEDVRVLGVADGDVTIIEWDDGE